MKTAILAIFLASLCSAADPINLNLSRVKVSVLVLSEDLGLPVEGAEVRFTFYDQSSGKELLIRRITDSDGLAVGEGGYTSPGINCNVFKEGFYNGWAPVPRHFHETDDQNRKLPWNETYTMVLRRVGNPIPLHAKSVWIEIPRVDEPCGYDLEIGDWVAPYGRGLESDFVFTLMRSYIDRQQFEVSVTLGFSHSLDGIQETDLLEVGRYSIFAWPRFAPDVGYSSALVTWRHKNPEDGFAANASKDQSFFFRVRTKEENNHIVSGLYGKIKGGLMLAPSNSETCKVKMTYYLNPVSLDRNLEWDTSINLFEELKRREEPQRP